MLNYIFKQRTIVFNEQLEMYCYVGSRFVCFSYNKLYIDIANLHFEYLSTLLSSKYD